MIDHREARGTLKYDLNIASGPHYTDLPREVRDRIQEWLQAMAEGQTILPPTQIYSKAYHQKMLLENQLAHEHKLLYEQIFCRLFPERHSCEALFNPINPMMFMPWDRCYFGKHWRSQPVKPCVYGCTALSMWRRVDDFLLRSGTDKKVSADILGKRKFYLTVGQLVQTMLADFHLVVTGSQTQRRSFPKRSFGEVCRNRLESPSSGDRYHQSAI